MNNNLPFNEQDIRRVLGSAEGQQILKLLNQDGGKALRAAASAYQKGDMEGAKKIIAPVMESPQASALVNQLNKGR
ncbi:MAG: hypothetical protein R3Y62_07715 [Eubacteriales bacterium]